MNRQALLSDRAPVVSGVVVVTHADCLIGRVIQESRRWTSSRSRSG